MSIRFHVEPKDVPARIAARRLGLEPEAFDRLLPKLLQRGFPAADPDTGNYDLDAIDAWRRSRNPQAFALTAAPTATDAGAGFKNRLASIGGGRRGWAK